MKTIHCHVYNPQNSIFKTGANDRAQSFVVRCDKTESCSLFARGRCLHRNVLGPYCVHGKQTSEVGPTKRAKNFHKWISEKTIPVELGKGSLEGSSPDSFERVEGYVAVLFPHVAMNEGVPFSSKAGVFYTGKPFIKNEDWAPSVVVSMLKFRPQALFGGEIASYQKEVVPKMMLALSRFDPPMLEKVLALDPAIRQRWDEMPKSMIGKKALLRTLGPGEVTNDKIRWKWDGTKLTHISGYDPLFLHMPRESFVLEVVPKKDAIACATDDSQITGDTIFS